jgi:hypothetical protein
MLDPPLSWLISYNTRKLLYHEYGKQNLKSANQRKLHGKLVGVHVTRGRSAHSRPET